MTKKNLSILTAWLLACPLSVSAELVESTTGVLLTFRHCVSGETACDSFGEMEASAYGGLPGEPTASAEHADPEFGNADGDAELKGLPGAAKLSANTISLPSARNGSNSMTLQRYTNEDVSAETLTFSATLTHEQTVPAENAAFSADSRARSGANAEIIVLWIDAESIEAGTTAEENITALFEDVDPSIASKELGFVKTSPFSNVSESGTETISSTVSVEPGDSIWLLAILQSLAANGAVVSATMDTELESAKTH